MPPSFCDEGAMVRNALLTFSITGKAQVFLLFDKA